MGRKKEGLIGDITKAVLIVYGIIDALRGFQTSLYIVDRMVEFAHTLSHPYDVYAVSLALVALGYAIRKFRTDINN